MSLNATVLAGFSAVFLGGVYSYFPELIVPAGILAAIPWIKFFVLDTSKAKLALNPEKWQQFVLTDKTKKSHNVALYRFALSNSNDILGLPIGQHISIQAEISERMVQRSYTPTSSDDDRGYFELLVKTYPAGVVSKYIDELKIGQSITVKGPRGKFLYKPGLVNAFGMIAGGTGITPMLQIIRAVLKNPSDRTKVNLIFANVNYDDILLKDELDDLAARHDNFEVYYVLNNPPEGWIGGVGFVTAAMIQEHCPAPAKDVKILLCGPPPMISAMSQHTEALGYDKPRALSKLEDQVFKF